MQIGIFAKTFTGDQPDLVMTAAARADYSCVQYNWSCSGLGSLPENISQAAISKVANAARDAGVRVSAVSATYNMIDPSAARREAGRRAFEAIAASARGIGCSLVTLCTGSLHAADQWQHHPGNAMPEAWAEMLAEFAMLVPIAEKHKVFLGVEPELANVVSSAKKARVLIDVLKSDRLRIVFDAANLFEARELSDQRQLVNDAVDLLAGHIVLAHAKDRKAGGGFAVPGQGALDFSHVIGKLKSAGFDGDLVAHGFASFEAEGVARHLKTLL